MAFSGDEQGEARMSVLTIGHSNHGLPRFLALLRGAGATAVGDVRSSPWSRHFPQFNREPLKASLAEVGIAYSFLGRELGGRPASPDLYAGGVADYERMAATDSFRAGLDRVIAGSRTYCIALMCAERDPLDCHRCLLVGRALAERGVAVGHILEDGSVLEHQRIEERLLALAGRSADDLFEGRKRRLAAAYRARGRKVAFAEAETGPPGTE